MTSEFTLGPTAKFFKEHDFFHLDPANVVLFEQRLLPAVTFEGRAILERKDKVAMAPGMAHPRQGWAAHLGPQRVHLCGGGGSGDLCPRLAILREADSFCHVVRPRLFG
jgi:hypothetical protein